MNNDLISRKYMKEAIEQFFVKVKYYHPHSKGRKTIPTEEVLDIIDNAPTVDTSDDKYLEERDADAYETGYLQGHIEVYQKAEKDYAIPIGEWKCICSLQSWQFTDEHYECDKCHYKGSKSNFCPNCGADMRKEENNG